MQGSLDITGLSLLEFDIGDKHITDEIRVSPNLKRELILGAGIMQKWDISIEQRKGATRVTIKKDMHDPDITAVE